MNSKQLKSNTCDKFLSFSPLSQHQLSKKSLVMMSENGQKIRQFSDIIDSKTCDKFFRISRLVSAD
jgi:hypothetical protein